MKANRSAPATWWSSVGAQVGNRDNALLRRKYGRSWRTLIGEGPGRMPAHAATTLAGAATIVGVLSGLDWISAGPARWLPGVLLTVVGLMFGIVATRHLRKHPHPILSLLPTRIQTYFATTIGGGA